MELSRTQAGAAMGLVAMDEAEERLAEAEVRLELARFEALLGIRYEADTFDHLILEYRAARRAADARREQNWTFRQMAAPAACPPTHRTATAGLAA